jgi:hypothetical protein
MEKPPVPKYTTFFGLALAICSVANALLVVAKEKSTAVQDAMQKMTGNHWVTHSALAVVLFFLLGWLLALANQGRGLNLASNRLPGIIATGVVAGGLIITGFYLSAD